MEISKIIFTLVFMLSISMVQTDELEKEFRVFIKRFEKEYKSEEEYNYRFDIFKQRYRVIEEFNKKGASYKKGINYFSDLTPKERFSFLGNSDRFNEDLPEIDDTKELADEIQSLPLSDYFLNPDDFLKRHPLLFRFPLKRRLRIDWTYLIWWIMMRNVCQSKDWHAEELMTDVRNQGSCGSCWAFAAVGLVEAMYKIQYGLTYNLSEQELVDCDGTNNGCSGGNMHRALTYIKDNNIYTEASYPYVASDETCSIKDTIKYSLNTINRTPRRSTRAFIDQLCESPVTVYYYVADDFFDYSSGIYDGADCEGETGVNHGVVAVGHHINTTTPFVKFKNSWGSWWGENGYFRMKLEQKLVTDGTCNMLKYASQHRNMRIYLSIVHQFLLKDNNIMYIFLNNAMTVCCMYTHHDC